MKITTLHIILETVKLIAVALGYIGVGRHLSPDFYYLLWPMLIFIYLALHFFFGFFLNGIYSNNQQIILKDFWFPWISKTIDIKNIKQIQFMFAYNQTVEIILYIDLKNGEKIKWAVFNLGYSQIESFVAEIMEQIDDDIKKQEKANQSIAKATETSARNDEKNIASEKNHPYNK